MYYYNSVTLPFLQLSALAEILEKIDAERKTKNISDDELLGLRLIDDMFTFGKQLQKCGSCGNFHRKNGAKNRY